MLEAHPENINNREGREHTADKKWREIYCGCRERKLLHHGRRWENCSNTMDIIVSRMTSEGSTFHLRSRIVQWPHSDNRCVSSFLPEVRVGKRTRSKVRRTQNSRTSTMRWRNTCRAALNRRVQVPGSRWDTGHLKWSRGSVSLLSQEIYQNNV